MSTKSQLKKWYDQNKGLADQCSEYTEEDPPGDLMYDAFAEFVEVMNIIAELGKNDNPPAVDLGDPPE